MLAPSNVPLLEAKTSPAASPMGVSFSSSSPFADSSKHSLLQCPHSIQVNYSET